MFTCFKARKIQASTKSNLKRFAQVFEIISLFLFSKSGKVTGLFNVPITKWQRIIIKIKGDIFAPLIERAKGKKIKKTVEPKWSANN